MVNSQDGKIPNGDANSSLTEAEGSLRDILQIAVLHRWTILLSTVFVLATAFIYILRLRQSSEVSRDYMSSKPAPESSMNMKE